MTEWVLVLVFITNSGVTSQSIDVPGSAGDNDNCKEALASFMSQKRASPIPVISVGYGLQR